MMLLANENKSLRNLGTRKRARHVGRERPSNRGGLDGHGRPHAPTLGRFLQTDPIGYADGTNWYNYVGGDPVNMIDQKGKARICVSTTGTRIPSCVEVDGNGDGNVKDNDLSAAQRAAFASSYHDAVVALSGQNISGYGKPVSGSASKADLAMVRVASQFFGATAGRGALAKEWSSINRIEAAVDKGAVAGYPAWTERATAASWTYSYGDGKRGVAFTGYRGGWFNYSNYGAPSDLAKMLIHETMHWQNGGVFLPKWPHIQLDERAKQMMRDSGLGHGGCQARGMFSGC